jgi:hypothetical protein
MKGITSRISLFAATAQRTMNRRSAIPVLIALAVLVSAAGVEAGDWGTFWPVSNGVSVSFAQVENSTYAWKFRNDGYNAVTSMRFTYSYIDADSGQYKTDSDVLPQRLSPGQIFGGWAAFSANARTQPTIVITEIERE